MTESVSTSDKASSAILGGLPRNKESVVLIISVFIAGLCSIIYELLIGTTSSYFLGDSVKQFSLTIGFYMAAMGFGSYISRYFTQNLLEKFIGVEILLGLLGGVSVPVLYLAFAYTNQFEVYKFGFILSIGALIGLEIPLLTRLMDDYYSLKVNISNILSLDYFGALIATLLFPFILLPFVGTFKSSLVFGLVNMIIGFINLWAFKDELSSYSRKLYFVVSVLATAILTTMLFGSTALLNNWHNQAYEDRVVFAKQSNYQSVVVTKNKEDIRLFLNGSLQFSSIDEYRYHESLIHVPMSVGRDIKNVLILGGGDGMAIRELLKYPQIEHITLVDLDPVVTEIAISNHYLKTLNQDSLKNSKVTILNKDAFVFLKESRQKFDFVVSDLPDPNNVSLARLYSIEFYKFLQNRMSDDAIFVSQATSPFFAKKTFWCIDRTIKYSGITHTYPYHVNVPSFAEWGFIMASKSKIDISKIDIQVETKFLENSTAKKAFLFGKDIKVNSKSYSSLDSPVVLNYYLSEWKYWN